MHGWGYSSYAFFNSFDIFVIGTSKVGKSTLIHVYVHKIAPIELELELELGSENCYNINVNHNDTFHKISIFDTPEDFDLFGDERLTSAKIILLCYSIDDAESFSELQHIFERIESQNTTGQRYAVAGLKKDQERNLLRQVDEAEGRKFADSIGAIGFSECSAKDGPVDDVFYPILDYLFEPVHESNENDDSYEDEVQEFNFNPTEFIPEDQYRSRNRKLSIIPSLDESSTADNRESSVPDSSSRNQVPPISSEVMSQTDNPKTDQLNHEMNEESLSPQTKLTQQVTTPVTQSTSSVSEEKGIDSSQPARTTNNKSINNRSLSLVSEEPKSKSGCCVIV